MHGVVEETIVARLTAAMKARGRLHLVRGLVFCFEIPPIEPLYCAPIEML